MGMGPEIRNVPLANLKPGLAGDGINALRGDVRWPYIRFQHGHRNWSSLPEKLVSITEVRRSFNLIRCGMSACFTISAI